MTESDDTKGVLPMSPRTSFCNIRNHRAQATFNLMMRMAPDALTAVRQEFHLRNDFVNLEQFIFIMSKHLISPNNRGSDNGITVISKSSEQLEFASNMYELFKEIDMNGDGTLEWEEFTRLTVEKARLLNKKYALSGIPSYFESSDSLDTSARYRHRNDISHLCFIPKMMIFAMTEDHKNVIWFINARSGKLISTIRTDAVPLAMENISEKDLLVATCADMTMIMITLDDPMPSKKFQIQAVWPTVGAQMSLAWLTSNHMLYSGSTSGVIYAWDIRKTRNGSLHGNTVAKLEGHKDIVMCLLGLTKLDNLVSASLDSTIGVWDTFTNTMILRLEGHRKGVFSLSYNPDFRLLVSCGFDHDAFVWSPFVNSLVFRLKGHHASLVGCHCVENSPEIITADSSGIFKVWDIRNFICVQTFATMDKTSEHSGSELTCFFHATTALPGSRQEVGARIFASSKWLFSYDQVRIINERSADVFEVMWTAFLEDSLQLITVSTRNVSIWDIILGSRTAYHENICGEEITACCLDQRKRKLLVGDSFGHVRVFNPINGASLKSCADYASRRSVQSISYVYDARRFIAAYADGFIHVYDDSRSDECPLLRSFAKSNTVQDLMSMIHSHVDHTVVSTASGSNVVKLWDYDSGKIDSEVVVCPTAEHIINIITLQPHPLIATADSVGNVILWGTLGSLWPGLRISGFLNQTLSSAEYETISRKNVLNAIDGSDQTLNPPPRIFPTDGIVSEDASLVSSALQTNHTAPTVSKSTTNEPGEDSAHQTASANLHLELIAYHVLQESVREGVMTMHKWGPVAAAKCMTWDPEGSQLYTGDMVGVLRKWDLTDLITDIGGTVTGGQQSKKAGQGTPKNTFKRTKRKHRNSRSALVPISSADTGYVVGSQSKGSYLGIEFSWAVTAHNESIIACEWTKYGLVTSCTERVLKMWSTDGKLIGQLMSGIPSGVRNHCWDVDIDVDTLMAREKETMNDIMERVVQIAKNGDIPIANGRRSNAATTTAAMAKLSTSSLRKRIEQSGRILGLVFEADESDKQRTRATDDLSTTSTSVKTKSPRSAVDEANAAFREDDSYQNKKVLSVGQRKRRERSMFSVIDKYEGPDSSLPKLRLKASGSHVDMNSIKDLSAFMHIEDPSLGRTRSAHPIKTKKKQLNRGISQSTDISTLGALPRSPPSRISVADGKAELMRKKCSQFESYSRLERTLSGLSIANLAADTAGSRRDLRPPALGPGGLWRMESMRSTLQDLLGQQSSAQLTSEADSKSP